MNDPLTTEVPESMLSKFMALAVAIAALGITSVIVGLVGAMAICEDTVSNIEVPPIYIECICFFLITVT